MITPVIVWNAQHGWASFEFQGARGVPSGELRPAQFLTMVLGEVAFLSPWIFAPLVAGIGERVPSLARRTVPVSALPQPAADRSLHPDAALGRPRPTSLDDARVVFCIRIDGRMGRRARRLHWQRFADGLSFRRRCLPRSPELAVLQASTGWPWAILTARVPSCRSDAGGIRMARSRQRRRSLISRPASSSQRNGRTREKSRSLLDLRFPFSCFRTIRAAGLSWTKAEVSSGRTGSSSRQRRKPHRLSPSLVPYSLGWDSPSFMRWVGAAAPRSSSRSFPPPA